MSHSSPHPKSLFERAVAGDEHLDPQTSLELLRRAQHGERAALEALITRCQDRLRRIVRIQLGGSVLRQHYDSMDIVQGTFQAALPKIAGLNAQSAGALLQWLSAIATNQVRDAYARELAQKRDLRRTQRLTDSQVSAPGNQVAALGALPDDHALLAEVRELLDDEVARLPDDQRRVVLLRDYCGQSWDDVAAELGRENGAARQLHQRAWIKLRQALRPSLEG